MQPQPVLSAATALSAPECLDPGDHCSANCGDSLVDALDRREVDRERGASSLPEGEGSGAVGGGNQFLDGGIVHEHARFTELRIAGNEIDPARLGVAELELHPSADE